MRNQVFKKLFSVLLALIMVAGLLPASAMAGGWGAMDVDTTPELTETEQPAEPTPEQGEPVAEPTPEQGEPTAEPVPTQGEPTAEPTDEGIMPANVMPVQANVELQYRIVHLDCGRKYFSKDWIIALMYEAKAAGYNQVQLAFGNKGLRFLLNDMSVTVDGTAYDAKSAIQEGNKAYYNAGEKNELTEAEMNEILAVADKIGIEIVPLFNTPFHMEAVITAMGKLNITNAYYGSNKACLNLSNDYATAFVKALMQKYITYFRDKGCKYFNFGADEYVGGWNTTFYNYANEIVSMISAAGMKARIFNDSFRSDSNNGYVSGAQVCYWASNSGYASTKAVYEYAKEIINTNQDFYYVVNKDTQQATWYPHTYYTFSGSYDEAKWVDYAKTFSNTTYKNHGSNNNGAESITPVGSMFCIWCDNPSHKDETQIAKEIRMILRVIGARMQNSDIYSASDVLVEGGFKADGTINVPTNNKTVGNGSGNTTADNDTVRVTGPNLAALKCKTATVTIQGAAEGKIAAYDVTPSTADNNKYTGEAEVRIKIPEGWDKTKVKAFIVEDGTAKDIDGTATEDGWYVFTAPHFSVMGIYEKAATTEVGGTIEIAKGSTGVITVPGDVTNNVGEIENDTVATKVKVEKVQQHGETISYSATASASIKAYQQYYYNASNLIDGRDDTYYWSNDVQTVDAYAQVDLGAAIPFDAVRIIPPTTTTNNDDAKCKADVEVSADGSSWTTIGSYDGTKITISNTAGNVRYIKVRITEEKANWWQLAEIQWGSYANGTFTRMAASGSVTTEGKTETQVTIKGIAGGETTIEIDGKTYTIKVVDATLAEQVLPINLWITNTGVVPDGWSNSAPAEFTYSDDGGNRRSIYTLKASHSTVNGPNGISLSSILPQVTGTAKSWDNNTYNVVYWKSAYHTAENRQSTDGWTNYSHKGTKFEYIRFYEGSWAYSVDGITWVNIENVGAGATDTDKNQVCIWYRQVTTVTSEVTTEIVDWGPIQYSANQCLLDFAVKYDGTSDRIPNSFPVTGKTIGFDCPTDQSVPLGNGYVVKDTDSTYYRTVYGIAGVETAEYEVYMITLTPSSDSHNVYINSGSTQTSYTYGGTEKIAWAKTEADTEHSVLGKISGVQYGGEPFLESVKIYQYQGLLVTYYLRAKQTFDSLTVHYAIQGSGTAFYEYNIAVSNNTFFSENIGLGDPKVGPLKNGTVVNSDGRTIEVSSDLSKLQDVDLQYRYSIYEVVGFWRESEKSIWIYYTFTRDHTYVIDFGLPLEIKLKDFGITTENMGDIDSISLASMKDKEAKPVYMQEWSHGKAEVLKDTGGNWYVKYILAKPLSNNITIPLYVKFKNRSDAAETLYNANIIPATSVYYEDSFAKFYGSDGKEQTGFSKTNEVPDQTPGVWYIDGQEKTATQALEALGEKTNHNVYGYDPTYQNSTMFSMGSARKVTVTSGMVTNWTDASAWPTAQFTFKGTGFDIISLTDNTSGAIFVDVYKGNSNSGEKEKGHVVNNYYGYTYSEGNGWEINNNPNAIYQVPVIKVSGLTYGEHTVVIKVCYDKIFDVADGKKYSFWLDAVRVYDPAGNTLDNDYVKDSEVKPIYVEVRKALIEKNNFTADTTVLANGAVFIDGKSTGASIDDYKNFGPNHEVYLAKDQAIAFRIVADREPVTVQIGVKLANGSSGTLKISGNNVVKFAAYSDVDANDTLTLNTATDMYYALNGITWTVENGSQKSNVIVLTNTGENSIVSITNVKCTYANAEESTANTVALAISYDDALMAVDMVNNAITPIEPEPEPEKTFEPERFEASWSRNVMQGRKATLTVKTSEDVEAITVDGQTIRSYRTRTERMGFGRRAKRITYREFTYSMVAQESADFSVTAINAEGTESEAITARLTVKTRPNSMRDMWDWFKGWF